jgi:plasmid stabilization system protein ParE
MTRYRVVWSKRARADLVAIGDFMASDDREAAPRWVTSLMEAAEAAARFPMAGRRVPEVARDDVREVFKRTYRIVYLVTDHEIEILTVLEGRKRLHLSIND